MAGVNVGLHLRVHAAAAKQEPGGGGESLSDLASTVVQVRRQVHLAGPWHRNQQLQPVGLFNPHIIQLQRTLHCSYTT